MRILVTLKRVPDPDTRIRIRADGKGIETEGVTFVANPFDEIALEEALRLREAGHPVEEIVVVSLGGEEVSEQIRRGLAMGADRGIRIAAPEGLDPLAIAKALAALVAREKPDLVFMGKQAIDDDFNQVGQMLAGLLGWPQATFASKVELIDGGERIRAAREVDTGLETVIVRLPAVLTSDLRLNEPRYVALPGILKARSKPQSEVALAELGVAVEPRVTLECLAPPPRRQAGTRVADVPELVRRLREEAKLL